MRVMHLAHRFWVFVGGLCAFRIDFVKLRVRAGGIK